MPSRKRAKGKARKAKAREGNCNLVLHNDSVCRHGCEVISKDDICYKLVEQLEVEMNEVIDSMSGELQLFDFYNATNKRMRANKKYDIIWNDDSDETRLKLQSLLVNLGTNLLLRLSSSPSTISAFIVVLLQAPLKPAFLIFRTDIIMILSSFFTREFLANA